MTDMPTVSRRAAVGGLAAVAAGVTLAACSRYDSNKSAAPASSVPAGSELAKTADIAVGSGVIVASKGVVITHPEAGTFKAFSAICTHQGCTVNNVSGDKIICPCHNSIFSASDGSVVSGPAPRPLTSVAITVAGDAIKLA